MNKNKNKNHAVIMVTIIRYHGSFRVAELDGGFVGFNRIPLSKKMCVAWRCIVARVLRVLSALRVHACACRRARVSFSFSFSLSLSLMLMI